MNFFSKLISSFKIFRTYKNSALVLLFVMFASALTESLSLGMIMPFLETIINGKSTSEGTFKSISIVLELFPDYYRLMVIVVLIGSLILMKNGFLVLKTWLSFRYSLRFRELWMSTIMGKYMNAEYLFLVQQKQGTLLNNLLTEPARAAKSLQQIISFLSNVVLAVFLYGMLLLVSWQITFGMTIVIGLLALLMRKASYNYSTKVGNKRLGLSQDINAIGAESISAIRQIKIFSLEDKSTQKFSDKLNLLFRMVLKFRIVVNLPKPVGESLIIVGFVLVLLYLQYVSKSSLVDFIPTIALFTIISQRFIPIVSTIYTERMDILSFLPSLNLVNDLYESNASIEDLDKGKIIRELNNDIVFDSLCFAYPNADPFFNDFSITIPKGKITAIVGSSGSGKSTIVDLLVGFLKSRGGKLLVNGTDIKEITMRSWRHLVGYISQATFLFNASVKDNILAGKPDASDEEIISAARQANADGFIRNLPQGYETLLGDRGLTISGGERQRIAIARVIIRNPDVLIFDEATSALDPESEKFIQESINALSGQKTIIIIAHRLSMVKNADQIIVLEKGEVVETGVHDELIKTGGGYSRLARGTL
ncbi:MAG TPA: ABC transporter ATP-binding protein [bacterium]|nr:ABC transporter ATP-binding protein [bacterium]